MLRLQKCHFFINSAAAVISVICTCGMSEIGEMVSSENEWGANSERSNHFQLCGAGFCVAQLVPVTPDWSVSPVHPHGAGCLQGMRSQAAPFKGSCSPCSLAHQGISSKIRSLWFPKQAD